MSIYSFILIAISLFHFSFTQPNTISVDPNPEELIGTWEVTFDNGPSADPSYTTLVIDKISQKTFEGSFYYSEMGECRLTQRNGILYLAFVTEDNSGYYASVGKWDGETMEGTTHSAGRDFLAIWTAEKKN